MTKAKTNVSNWKPWFNVTDNILSVSKPGNSSHCFIAKTAQTLGAHHIHVSTDRGIRFSLGEYRFRYDIPPSLAVRIEAFDQKAKIKPFKIRLGAPISVSKIVRQPKRQGKSLPRNGKYKGVSKKKHCGPNSAWRFNGMKNPPLEVLMIIDPEAVKKMVPAAEYEKLLKKVKT